MFIKSISSNWKITTATTEGELNSNSIWKNKKQKLKPEAIISLCSILTRLHDVQVENKKKMHQYCVLYSSLAYFVFCINDHFNRRITFFSRSIVNLFNLHIFLEYFECECITTMQSSMMHFNLSTTTNTIWTGHQYTIST